MPFLTLNSVTIPTAKGGEVDPIEIGKRDRSHNGGLFLQRVGIKRRWRYTTVPLTDEDARAIIGLVQGEGHRWNFGPIDSSDRPIYPEDGTLDLTEYLFSDTGLGPTTTSQHASVEGNKAVDFDAVEYLAAAPATYVSAAKFNNGGAMWSTQGATNLVGANERDCEDVTGFLTVSTGAKAANTANKWQGTQSLKVTFGSGTGVETPNIAVSASTTYVATAYFKGNAGGEDFIIRVQDQGGGGGTSTIFTAKANTWVRVPVTHTTAVGITNVRIQFLGNSGSGDVYVDGVQLETNSDDMYTAWVDGTNPNTDVIIPYGFLESYRSFSFGFWTRGSQAISRNPYIFGYGDSNSEERRLRAFFLNNGSFRWSIGHEGNDETTTVSTSLFTTLQNTWHHFAGTYEYDTRTMRTFVDGTQENSLVIATQQALNGDTYGTLRMKLGEWPFSSLNTWYGNFCDLFIVPYRMSASMISDIAGATVGAPQYPLIGAAGDSIGDEVVNVLGRVSRTKFVGTARAGTWKSNDRVVTFELEEA